MALGGAGAGSIPVERAGTDVLARTLLATALLFCALAAVTNGSLALALLVLVGALDAVGWVMFEATLQRSADPDLLARAFGLTDAVVRTPMIGSIALAPLTNAIACPDAILLASAAMLTLAAIVAASRSARLAAHGI